jgi:hypothetical protein
MTMSVDSYEERSMNFAGEKLESFMKGVRDAYATYFLDDEHVERFWEGITGYEFAGIEEAWEQGFEAVEEIQLKLAFSNYPKR